MFFATCSVAGAPSALQYSTTADMSGEPVMRSARANARRRTASDRHRGSGCNQAPRPARLPAGSTTAAGTSPGAPISCREATTRISSTASSRFRHPTHVRTGPSARRCARTGFSRWITVQSSVESAHRPKRLDGPRTRSVRGPVGTLGRRVTADVDPPTGQPGRESGVLAFLADRQRQLEVRHHHPGRAGNRVDHGHRHHLGR